MSDYGPPQPPDQPYDPGAYGPQPGGAPVPPSAPQPAPPTSPFKGLGAKLGERAVRRPEPRFAVSIAGAGVALALFGALLWMASYVGDGLSTSVRSTGSTSDGSYISVSANLSTDRNYVGAVVFLAFALAGYGIVVRRRSGPLATAGVVAGAVAVPLCLGFLTFDLTSLSGGFPINLDLVFWLSLIVWLGSYLFVPGARGRSFFIFLSAYWLYVYVLFQSAKNDIAGSISRTIGGDSGPSFSGLDTVVAVSLIFGLGYYLIAFLLDRKGRHGSATGLLYPAFAATYAGLVALAIDTESAATIGVVVIIIGAVLSLYAGRYGRRFTCWVWAGGVAGGVIAIVADASPDNNTAAGISLLVIGLIVVAVAALAARALREPDDLDPNAVVRSR